MTTQDPTSLERSRAEPRASRLPLWKPRCTDTPDYHLPASNPDTDRGTARSPELGKDTHHTERDTAIPPDPCGSASDGGPPALGAEWALASGAGAEPVSDADAEWGWGAVLASELGAGWEWVSDAVLASGEAWASVWVSDAEWESDEASVSDAESEWVSGAESESESAWEKVRAWTGQDDLRRQSRVPDREWNFLRSH